VRGYLFTSGFISAADEMTGYACDHERWVASVELARMPDPELMRKRLYTSGCGKCAMYTTVGELSMRQKLESSLKVDKKQILSLAQQVAGRSELFRLTGAVHSALLADPANGREIIMDDVARHNAVDKVVGKALAEAIDFSQCILARTGRTSSEIVYKVRRCGIQITIARGAPTHQAVHLAREMGITLIGFARDRSFNIYSCPERVVVENVRERAEKI
jgi:FdhD protein